MTTEPTPRHFTASMVVIDTTTARVLLIHHNASGLLQFPGGHVDPNEAPTKPPSARSSKRPASPSPSTPAT